MDDQTTSAEDPRTGSRHLSRRTVLRAAGHAAWAVPAIQFVGTAPAFAAASDGLQITAASGQWTLSGGLDYMVASITVANNSPNDPTALLQVTLTLPNPLVYGPWFFQANGTPGNRTVFFSQVSAGWGTPVVTYSGTGTGRTGTAVFTPSVQIPVGGTATLTCRVTTFANVSNATASGASDAVSVQATATGFVPASGAFNPAA